MTLLNKSHSDHSHVLIIGRVNEITVCGVIDDEVTCHKYVAITLHFFY